MVHHLENFLKINPNSKAVVALNKSDLLTSEKLTKLKQIYEFGDRDLVLRTCSTSAKTGATVEEIFYQLASNII